MEGWTPEAFVGRLKKIPRRQWYAFAGVWLAGLFAHGYMFANKLPNPDDLVCLWDKGVSFELGRWALPIVGMLDGTFSSPWMLGLLSMLLFSIAAMQLVEILRLKSPLFCALAGTSMIAFPTVVCMFAYMFTSDAYTLAVLLCILAVRFCRKGLWGRLGAVVCIAFSLGLYQAFFGLVPALLVYDLFLQCMEPDARANRVFVTGLCDLAVLAGGSGLYFLINYLACTAQSVNIEFSGRMHEFSIGALPEYIHRAYEWFFYVWRDPANGITETPSLRFLMTSCEWLGILLILVLAVRQLRRKKALEAGLGLVMIALFPIGVNLICLAGQSYIHTLMFYPMCLVPLVFLSLCERWNTGRDPQAAGVPLLVRLHNAGRWVCVCLVAALAFLYARQANEIYLDMQINHSRHVAYWTSISTQIRSLPGFSEWTEVVFIYEDGWDRSTPGQWKHENFNELIGVRLDYHSYADRYLLNYYLGYAPHYLDPADYIDRPEVREMPAYPDDGSIRMVEGAAVVKF